jgi:glycosyltransferase involved in cell wall biosynthesis
VTPEEASGGPGRSLRIAWVGAGPGARETGGVPGVATDLLYGLAKRGHQIDCLFPGSGHKLPDRLEDEQNLTFIWGTRERRWNRWYNRTRIGAFVSGLLFRGLASVRLRQDLTHRHREDPYDVIYQFSSIEALAVPSHLRHDVPLVIHPETHVMGELRFLISEYRLGRQCQPTHSLVIAAAVMSARAVVQRIRIRRASLLVCISGVFRDHLVADYRFPLENTIVIPNPVRLERFADSDRVPAGSPTILVLGRVSVRKGVQDVVAVARVLLERGVNARLRVVGGPSMWSDYTRLLDDLPDANAEYVGRIAPAEIPAELAGSDVLLQASRYEPFGLTVAEALASGVPVVATTAVGAIEGVDSAVLTAVEPGDVAGMVSALTEMLERTRQQPEAIKTTARAEADRLFAADRVCQQVSDALEKLVIRG